MFKIARLTKLKSALWSTFKSKGDVTNIFVGFIFFMIFSMSDTILSPIYGFPNE